MSTKGILDLIYVAYWICDVRRSNKYNECLSKSLLLQLRLGRFLLTQHYVSIYLIKILCTHQTARLDLFAGPYSGLSQEHFIFHASVHPKIEISVLLLCMILHHINFLKVFT